MEKKKKALCNKNIFMVGSGRYGSEPDQCFTKGKKYEVVSLTDNELIMIDDKGRKHTIEKYSIWDGHPQNPNYWNDFELEGKEQRKPHNQYIP